MGRGPRWLHFVGVENKANGVVISEFDYTRRADGQITKVEESIAQPGGGTETNTATFTYDALNRLTQEVVETSTAGGDHTKEYVLDLVGNRLTLIETKEGQSPVTTTSTYDARDRLLTETTGAGTLNYGYNANGSLTTKHEVERFQMVVSLAGDALNGDIFRAYVEQQMVKAYNPATSW